MSKVFFDVGLSLDGFMAGENRSPDNPIGDNGTTIHEWMFKQHAFWKHHGKDEGNKEGIDNQLIEDTVARIGANIMGKRMFEEGAKHWQEDLFKTPVYVLTHEVREPWVQKGSTTFYFINDSIHSALEKAKATCNGKDIRISGGVNAIQQYLNAGLIDEFSVHVSPVILGKGIRLLDNLNRDKIKAEIAEAIHSPDVTHIKYVVKK